MQKNGSAKSNPEPRVTCHTACRHTDPLEGGGETTQLAVRQLRVEGRPDPGLLQNQVKLQQMSGGEREDTFGGSDKVFAATVTLHKRLNRPDKINQARAVGGLTLRSSSSRTNVNITGSQAKTGKQNNSEKRKYFAFYGCLQMKRRCCRCVGTQPKQRATVRKTSGQ